MRYGEYEGYRGYGEYNEYGRRGRGRYRGGRGSGRYRGDEMIEDMKEEYGNYSESRNYGDGQESMKSLDYMLKATHQFLKMLQDDASSEEEMQLIKQYARKIGDM